MILKCPVCQQDIDEEINVCKICSWKVINITNNEDEIYNEKIERHKEIYETIVNALSATSVNNNHPSEDIAKKNILEKSFMDSFEKKIETKINNISDMFEEKLLYDESKEGQIDKLHNELQKYKTDLIAKTNRPLVNGIIRIFDDINKLIYHLSEKSEEELTPQKFFKVLDGVKEDIEILLDQNGILSFSEGSETFEPKRQQAIVSVKTLDENIVGSIAKRIRVGFEQADDLIQKERVSVYVLDKLEVKSKSDHVDRESLTESLVNNNMEENNEQ